MDFTKDDFNSVKLIGRLGTDPEVRFSKNGIAVASVTIATGGGKKKDGGEWPTSWIPIKAFGDTGEALGKMKKGNSIQITKGELEEECWTTSEGMKRSKLAVKVWEFNRMEKKDVANNDDDIPF